MEALKLNDQPVIEGFETPAMKRCRCCGELKPISEFHIDRSHKDNHDSCCKLCKSNNRKKMRQAKKVQSQKTDTQEAAANKVNLTLSLKNIPLSDITMELRSRGYSGQLRRITTVNI